MILIGPGGVLVLYFGLYFAIVRTTMWEGKAAIVPGSFYRPFDVGVVRAIFAPAHLHDAAYFCPRQRLKAKPFRDSHKMGRIHAFVTCVCTEVCTCTFPASTPLSWGCETKLLSPPPLLRLFFKS
jgi:hypothetical protein